MAVPVLLRAMLGWALLGDPSGEAAEHRIVLTRAVRDLSGKGQRYALSVVMVSGTRRNDDTPWCGMGDKYEGQFVISVKTPAGKVVDTALAEIFEPQGMWFWAGRWSIAFADYNHDGWLDFNLGQYGACSTWTYRLLTVTPSGRVVPLNAPELYTGDRQNSTLAIELTRHGFRSWWSDNSRTGDDQRVCTEYRWNAGQRKFERVFETSGACE